MAIHAGGLLRGVSGRRYFLGLRLSLFSRLSPLHEHTCCRRGRTGGADGCATAARAGCRLERRVTARHGAGGADLLRRAATQLQCLPAALSLTRRCYHLFAATAAISTTNDPRRQARCRFLPACRLAMPAYRPYLSLPLRVSRAELLCCAGATGHTSMPASCWAAAAGTRALCATSHPLPMLLQTCRLCICLPAAGLCHCRLSPAPRLPLYLLLVLPPCKTPATPSLHTTPHCV